MKDVYLKNPELKRDISKSTINLWKNDSYRKSQIESRKKLYKNHPELVENLANFNRNRFKDPKEREKQSKKSKEIYKDERLKNLHAKQWVIIYPDKHEEIIKNMREFCRKENLDCEAMYSIAKGIQQSHKKFKCKRLEDIKNEINCYS